MHKKEKIIVSIIFLFLGIFIRLLPHPWNFSPVLAIALFSGVYLGKSYAVSLPILIMLLSDIFLGLYDWKLMVSVYASVLLSAFVGIWLKNHKRWYTTLGSSLFCSILFFLVTNFAVWAFTSWYPESFSGITQCYLMAIPFFRNSLLGDLFYVTTVFGAYEIAAKLAKERKLALSMRKF